MGIEMIDARVVSALVRRTMQQFVGKPYNEIEVREALIGAFKGEAPSMQSEPHILDLEMVRDLVTKEMDLIEERLAKAGYYSDLNKLVSPDLEQAKGEHRAYFSIKLRLLELMASWRDNTPMSRKAEILVNGEGPDAT